MRFAIVDTCGLQSWSVNGIVRSWVRTTYALGYVSCDPMNVSMGSIMSMSPYHVTCGYIHCNYLFILPTQL